MSNKVVIRRATPEDIPTILAFMHATAAEQSAAPNVKATEQDLLDSIDFSPQPHAGARGPNGRFAKVLLAVSPDGDVAGMAIYFLTFAAWLGRTGVCLEDLFVAPEHRRSGYARDLVQAIAREANDLGCERMEWQCYKDNARALQFYKSLGAKVLEPITYLRLDKEGMVKLAEDEV